MHLVVNALPLTNLSGRHVMMGHLRRIADEFRPDLTILHHPRNAGLRADLGPGVRWRACPPWTRHWLPRSLWELACLPGALRELRADALVLVSGTTLPGLGIPQVSFAMNPWAFVPSVHRGPGDRFKAALQRRAYALAPQRAWAMVYLSRYLEGEYRRLGAPHPARAVVAGTAPGPDALAAGAPGLAARLPGSLLCVSAMAPHKGVDALVETLALLRERRIEARLTLVGPWPDRAYERRIRILINSLGLGAAVAIRGHLSREELLDECGKARVFVILSRCESFGIPGLEAQCRGTPVVCSRVGAMPEVYGEGCIAVPEGDPAGAAEAAARLLTDPEAWARLSAAAKANANRFAPARVSGPVLALFAELAASSGGKEGQP